MVEREPSDEGVLGTLQYLYHLRLLDVVLASRHASEAHAVAGESPHRVAFSHEDRLVGVVGHDRVLAVRLALEHALLHLSLHIQLIRVVGDARDEVVPRHLLHDVNGEHLQRMRVEM